jgi:cytochrome c biogenesis protein CcmG/thiol:disulfide interchange protein DsbE
MTWRRQLAVVLGVLAIVAALLWSGRKMLGNEISPIGVGVEAPDFTAVTLDSVPRMRTLADYRGNVLLINIWATWCGPCRIEMPSIEQLHRTYGPKGLKIVAVSIDDPGMQAQIRDFVKQYGLTFQILYDPSGEISRKYQTTGYPQTVIIGRDGLIRKKLIGASDWNSAENRGLVERLLAEKPE